MPLTHRLLTTITALYVAGLTGLLITQELSSGPHWSFALLRELLAFTFIPLPGLLLAALITRAQPVLVLLTVPAIAFIGLFGELFVPSTSASASGTAFVIRTHNVAPRNEDAEAETLAIQRDQPDVVVLQELNRQFAEALTAEIGPQYPHRALRPSDHDEGYGILSQHPLSGDACMRPLAESRCWQYTTVSVGTQTITVVNVHARNPAIATVQPRWAFGQLPVRYDTSLREREIRAAVEWLDQLPRPLIVAGDFNLAPHTSAHRLLTQRLIDTHAAVGVGLGHTWPSVETLDLWPVPLVARIDYIFVSPDIQPIRVEVDAAGGSDHHAVTAWLALPD